MIVFCSPIAPPALLKNHSSCLGFIWVSPYVSVRLVTIWSIILDVFVPCSAIAVRDNSWSIVGSRMYHLDCIGPKTIVVNVRGDTKLEINSAHLNAIKKDTQPISQKEKDGPLCPGNRSVSGFLMVQKAIFTPLFWRIDHGRGRGGLKSSRTIEISAFPLSIVELLAPTGLTLFGRPSPLTRTRQ